MVVHVELVLASYQNCCMSVYHYHNNNMMPLYHCIDKGSEVTAMIAAKTKIFVGTSGGKVAVLNSETKTFLVTYSWHEGKIYKLLLLPEESKPCICAEIPFKSPELPISTTRTPAISNPHSIPNHEPNAAMIISIGEGRIKQDVTCAHRFASNSHLIVWKS